MKIQEIEIDEIAENGLAIDEAGSIEILPILDSYLALEDAAGMNEGFERTVRVNRELGLVWESESTDGWHRECILSGLDIIEDYADKEYATAARVMINELLAN